MRRPLLYFIVLNTMDAVLMAVGVMGIGGIEVNPLGEMLGMPLALLLKVTVVLVLYAFTVSLIPKNLQHWSARVGWVIVAAYVFVVAWNIGQIYLWHVWKFGA